MVRLQEETYTGRSLREMSLAEKELELAKDWAYLQGLRRGFLWNSAHIGTGYALKITAEKAKLRLQGKLENVIASYERQIAEDRSAIAQDKEALESDGYRGVRLSDKVQSVLDQLTASNNPENIRDTLIYAKLKMEELEKERRKHELDEKHPDRNLGRLGGKVRNFFAHNMSILAPVSLALTLGGGSWYAATTYFENQNKNRPAHLVTPLLHPESESVSEEHPGVEAAIAVNDAAMAGNGEVNQFLNSDATAYDSKGLTDIVLPLVRRSKEKITLAAEYYNKKGSGIPEIVLGSTLIGDAWSHYSSETGHHELRTRITTDSEGEITTEIDDVYVCDYVDHTWKFDPEIARSGFEVFGSGFTALDIPEVISTEGLHARVKGALEKDPLYKSLSPEERKEKEDMMTDFLHAVTIEGNNLLASSLYHIQGPVVSEFAWIKLNAYNRSIFPLADHDRDYLCGSGDPPEGYRKSKAFASSTYEVEKVHHAIASSVNKTSTLLGEFERIILDLEKEGAGQNPSRKKELLGELGEITIASYDALNPDGSYSPTSKGWRIAVPLLFLFGLGTAGGLGGYFLARTIKENRFHRRMLKRGNY